MAFPLRRGRLCAGCVDSMTSVAHRTLSNPSPGGRGASVCHAGAAPVSRTCRRAAAGCAQCNHDRSPHAHARIVRCRAASAANAAYRFSLRHPHRIQALPRRRTRGFPRDAALRPAVPRRRHRRPVVDGASPRALAGVAPPRDRSAACAAPRGHRHGLHPRQPRPSDPPLLRAGAAGDARAATRDPRHRRRAPAAGHAWRRLRCADPVRRPAGALRRLAVLPHPHRQPARSIVLRRRFGMRYWSLSEFLKRRSDAAERYIDRYRQAGLDDARRRGLDGIVCGHIHRAALEVRATGWSTPTTATGSSR